MILFQNKSTLFTTFILLLLFQISIGQTIDDEKPNEYRIQTENTYILLKSNQMEEAEKRFYSIYENTINQIDSKISVRLDAFRNLLFHYTGTDQYKKADDLIQKSKLDFESRLHSDELLSDFYYYLFLYNYSCSNFHKSHEYSQKCFEKIKSTYHKEKVYRALQSIGISYYKLNEISVAKEYLHRAVDIQMELNTGKNTDLALSYNFLGSVYRALENFELAIVYKRKATEIYEEIYGKTHFCTCSSKFTESLYWQDKVHKTSENFDSKLYEQLFDPDRILANGNDVYSAFHKDDLELNYLVLAWSYFKANDYKNSTKFILQALNTKQGRLEKASSKLRLCYHLMANNFFHSSQFDSAIYFYTKAIQLYKAKPDGIKLESNQELSNYELSFDLMNVTVSLAKCLSAKAGVEGNKLDCISYIQALGWYEFADQIEEALRPMITNKNDKILLSARMNPFYNILINNCFVVSQNCLANQSASTQLLEKAFYFSQKNKAQMLEELILKTSNGLQTEIPDSLKQKEKTLQEKISFWERKISNHYAQDSGDYDHPSIFYQKRVENKSFNQTAFNDSLIKFTKTYSDLIEYYNQQFPQYYDKKFKTRPHTVKEIQGYLDEKSAVVDYHLNSNTIDIFVITKENFTAKQVPIAESIDSIIKVYRQSLSGHFRKEDFLIHSYDQFIENSQVLYRYLLQPIEESIKEKTKLIIIISDALSLLPFETLIKKNTTTGEKDLANLDYLIKKYDVVYNYSTNLWIHSINKSLEYKNEPSNLLVVAPVFDSKKMVLSNANQSYTTQMKAQDFTNLKPLYGTKTAADEIGVLAKTNNLNCFEKVYGEATKKAFSDDSKQKKYILLATHGRSDDENPNFGGLYFAAKDANDHAFLYSNEIYHLIIQTDLLVLFACETGVGAIHKGEGIMSVSRGFMAAGAANIVHTLWSIQDASTKDLVVNMFKSVFNQTTYAESLRQSKQQMIRYGIIPFHWSGLVLLGN